MSRVKRWLTKLEIQRGNLRGVVGVKNDSMGWYPKERSSRSIRKGGM